MDARVRGELEELIAVRVSVVDGEIAASRDLAGQLHPDVGIRTRRQVGGGPIRVAARLPRCSGIV